MEAPAAACQIRGVVQANPLVAIIDDDVSLRAALSGLVRSLGYSARDFACAEDFLAWPGCAGSACIVSDIQMPGLSGIELKQHLNGQGCTAPVIMITARTDPGLAERAMAAGAHCVLRKPFEADALIACLEKALAG